MARPFLPGAAATTAVWGSNHRHRRCCCCSCGRRGSGRSATATSGTGRRPCWAQRRDEPFRGILKRGLAEINTNAVRGGRAAVGRAQCPLAAILLVVCTVFSDTAVVIVAVRLFPRRTSSRGEYRNRGTPVDGTAVDKKVQFHDSFASFGALLSIRAHEVRQTPDHRSRAPRSRGRTPRT